MASLRIAWCLLSLSVFVHHIRGDVYFHVPRGSNNRLNAAGANRQNANRVFNSQVCVTALDATKYRRSSVNNQGKI
jgi:hypothetical protein